MRNKSHVFLLVIVLLVTVAAIGGAAVLFAPSAPDIPRAATSPEGGLLDGRITGIQQGEPDPEAQQVLSPDAQPLTITVRLDGGRDVTFDMIDETGDTFAVGQQVRVVEVPGPDDDQFTYYINDIKREMPLAVLGAIFLVAVLAFGRWKGLRALVGLGITLAIVVGFVVPAVLAGRDPGLVALTASVVIMVVTLYLSHGVHPKTTAAAVGTLGALVVTVGLSWAFIQFASLTGLADEEARMASVQVGGLSLRGLLLAGIIIGALGVLDDVTMSQASAVFEFSDADRSAGSSQLFARAMRVGRDHVAATINTLFLAYAGASLPLLILFSGSPDPVNVILSSEVVAVEIVRTLVGSIGLMASVPLTTALAAWLAARRAAAADVAAAAAADVAAAAEIGARRAGGAPTVAGGAPTVAGGAPTVAGGAPTAAGATPTAAVEPRGGPRARARPATRAAGGGRSGVPDWSDWSDRSDAEAPGRDALDHRDGSRGTTGFDGTTGYDRRPPVDRAGADERPPVGDRVGAEERRAARPFVRPGRGGGSASDERRMPPRPPLGRSTRGDEPAAEERPTQGRGSRLRGSRRRKVEEEPTAFSDVKPFSADDAAESEWEKRLRDSYKLDQLHAARQQTIRRYEERQRGEDGD